MRDCATILKIYKIYETESYINYVMEYQEGGTLGDMIED